LLRCGKLTPVDDRWHLVADRYGFYRQGMIKHFARFASLMGAALFGLSVLPPPAHAATGYLCLMGTAVRAGDTWTISSPGCTGSGTRDVQVLIWSGPSAGTYQCQRVSMSPIEAELDATGCVKN
jgi:hypothetical protein